MRCDRPFWYSRTYSAPCCGLQPILDAGFSDGVNLVEKCVWHYPIGIRNHALFRTMGTWSILFPTSFIINIVKNCQKLPRAFESRKSSRCHNPHAVSFGGSVEDQCTLPIVVQPHKSFNWQRAVGQNWKAYRWAYTGRIPADNYIADFLVPVVTLTIEASCNIFSSAFILRLSGDLPSSLVSDTVAGRAALSAYTPCRRIKWVFRLLDAFQIHHKNAYTIRYPRSQWLIR